MPVIEKFTFTRQPQEAVLATTIGFTGGMGQPMIDPVTGGPRWHKGFPVCVDLGEFEDDVRSHFPQGHSGRLHIILTGLVKLSFRIGRNWSIPGMHFQGYWEVRVKRLDAVEVQVFSPEPARELDPKFFFAALRELCNHLPFGPERIEDLVRSARFATGAGQQDFSRAEVQVAAGAETVRAILAPGEVWCITQLHVIEQYGICIAEVVAGAPPDGSMDYVYRFDWGSIRFRFPIEGPDRLLEVVLDAKRS